MAGCKCHPGRLWLVVVLAEGGEHTQIAYAPPLVPIPVRPLVYRLSKLLRVQVERRCDRGLGWDRILASASIAAEDLLDVLDVDVKVVEARLEVEPLVVERAAEERTVVERDQLLV